SFYTRGEFMVNNPKQTIGFYLSTPVPAITAEKARQDCEQILETLSLERVPVSARNIGLKLWGSGKTFPRLVKFSLGIRFAVVYARDVITYFKGKDVSKQNIFFQGLLSPWEIPAVFCIRFLFRRGKRVLLVHDLESIRLRSPLRLLLERIFLKQFTDVIVHSSKMEEYVKERLKYRGKLHVLGLFDFLISDVSNLPRVGFPDSGKFEIVFAGNLSPQKSRFLYELIALRNFNPQKFVLKIYGPNFLMEEHSHPAVRYCGYFPPSTIYKELSGHFGLVWDGDSAEKLSGNTGLYLLYNSPHKVSAYIVSGMPIICPKSSAISEMIEKFNIGFCVDSLLELDKTLEKISKAQYEEWKKNVESIAKKISSGEFLKRIVKEILS
ncbi:hypothetical protein, partial [Fervidobacterium thailandense]